MALSSPKVRVTQKRADECEKHQRAAERVRKENVAGTVESCVDQPATTCGTCVERLCIHETAAIPNSYLSAAKWQPPEFEGEPKEKERVPRVRKNSDLNQR
jgi:hypothetical protein